MSKSGATQYLRPAAKVLSKRLQETRRFIQVVAGPRQVGKTTMVLQVLERAGRQFKYASADEPTLRGRDWIDEQWELARASAGDAGRKGCVLALDEIQKITGWSEAVKRLWDEDTVAGRRLRVVILGSAPLLIERGLSESLAGRFEVIHLPHWSYPEMSRAFGWTLEQYLYFGGYPGSVPLITDVQRWSRYVLDSLIETTIARDVLLLNRVDKPALLRRLFQLACSYSGQVLSYTKMLGQLHDAGNTTTLAHYLDLLTGAGMVTGLSKYSGAEVRRRGSSPKLQVYNTALMTAQGDILPDEARDDGAYWGRLVESAVGAHLVNAQASGKGRVYYWRDPKHEVDFVVALGRSLVAIEVKSGTRKQKLPGLAAFNQAFKPQRRLLVGANGIPLGEFLSKPLESWLKD